MTLKSSPRLAFIAKTDVGKVRKINEDSWFADPVRRIFVVADGMGGHERGEWASAKVTNAMASIDPDLGIDALVDQMATTIHSANDLIFVEAQKLGISMGTTIVCLCAGDGQFGVLWAGDSRAYIYRDRQLIQLTKDHTRVQELIDGGLLDFEQARGHPMGHILSRAVGVEATLEVDAIIDKTEDGDLFMLCSDGLYGLVSDDEIRHILDTFGLEDAANHLIDMTLERGAQDNITLILVRVNEATELTLPSALQE
jgi:serine/threonine protein phosphatase PrpC